MRFVSIVAMSLVLAAPAVAGGEKLPPDRMPSEMTPTEIKAYNADINESHPYYIKCRKTEVLGSLAKKSALRRPPIPPHHQLRRKNSETSTIAPITVATIVP